MTREETKELLMTIKAVFPNFNVKPEEMTPTINAWQMMLEEYSLPEVKQALQIYVRTSGAGFAPSVSQLISAMYKPKEQARLSDGEAWMLVKKAIRDGNYHSAERFEELPESIKKAVGDANMIREWAMCDSEEVNTVIASNFQRTYRKVVSRLEFQEKLPDGLVEKGEEKTYIAEKSGK